MCQKNNQLESFTLVFLLLVAVGGAADRKQLAASPAERRIGEVVFRKLEMVEKVCLWRRDHPSLRTFL